MTIKELIKKLQEFDGDHPVILEFYYDCGYGHATRDIEEIQFASNGATILAQGDG